MSLTFIRIACLVLAVLYGALLALCEGCGGKATTMTPPLSPYDASTDSTLELDGDAPAPGSWAHTDEALQMGARARRASWSAGRFIRASNVSPTGYQATSNGGATWRQSWTPTTDDLDATDWFLFAAP